MKRVLYVLESARFRRYIEIQPVFLDLPKEKACYMYVCFDFWGVSNSNKDFEYFIDSVKKYFRFICLKNQVQILETVWVQSKEIHRLMTSSLTSFYWSHCHYQYHTVIPSWIYQIPSELWSQAGLGLASTVVGDHTGILGAVCFFTHKVFPHRIWNTIYTKKDSYSFFQKNYISTMS